MRLRINMYMISLILVMLAFSPFNSIKVGAEVVENANSTDKITLLLPVNVSSQPRINMSVMIPKEYRSIQSVESFANRSSPVIEFIPKNETPNTWTEIITASKYIGNKISASDVTKILKDNIFRVAKGKVISEANIDKGKYKQSMVILEYTHQNQTEVMGMLYNSGPYDCVGVQYTIRPKLKQHGLAVEKINNFFNENTSMISF